MWFNFKKKKEEKKVMNKANDLVKEMVLQKALEENKEKENKIKELNKAIVVTLENSEELRNSNRNLENNLEVLQNTIEKIREICKTSNGRVIGVNTILKELGE